jgi:hypothetical protein
MNVLSMVFLARFNCRAYVALRGSRRVQLGWAERTEDIRQIMPELLARRA